VCLALRRRPPTRSAQAASGLCWRAVAGSAPSCLLGVVGFALRRPEANQFCRCPAESRYGCLSMFVVVAFVWGVPVSIVDVVQMVAVEDGGVAASLAMHVDVLLGRLVHR
jgi:hypothetical protein